jgi:hypothetical protein
MTDYREDPKPQYEKRTPTQIRLKPVKVTKKIISDLVEIVKENKELLRKAETKYQL